MNPVQNKLHIKKLVILFLVAIVSLIIFYKFFNPVQDKSSNQPDDQKSGSSDKLEEPQSVFGSIGRSDYRDEIKNISKIFASSSDTEYFGDSWFWETHMFTSRVMEVEKDTKSMYLDITRPNNNFFKDSLPIHVKVKCDLEKTVEIAKKNVAFVRGGFNIFDRIGSGDPFISYCLDENCRVVGGSCYFTDLK